MISNNDEDKGAVVEEWVSTNKVHLIRELPAGDYVLREITAPYGYDVAEDIEFTVKENVIVTNTEMYNKPLKIGTAAMDEQTGSHHGAFSEEETITDVVELSGLYEGRTYKVSGKIVDKESGQPISVNGKPITAEKSFTAVSESGTEEMTFTFDSTLLADKTVVVFEDLFITNGEGKEVKIGSHADVKDAEQSVKITGPEKAVKEYRERLRMAMGETD